MIKNMWWKYLLGIGMCAVIYAAFLYAPRVRDLGESTRILFFHVPAAWVGFIAFIVAMVYSIKYLVKRDIVHDIWAASAAQIGLVFTILATVTGAIWAKEIWQEYWNWDPRQTSIFMVLLIYAAYFTLRAVMEDEEQRARLSAVYAIIAALAMPFLIFVVPRILESLHPDPVINTEGKVKMDPAIQLVLYSSVSCFILLFYWMLRLRVAAEQISQKLDSLSEGAVN